MASVNKVTIVGNLGRDPETRYMPSGDAMTNIAVATTDKWKDKTTGEQKEATEWHRIAFFGKLAEIAKFDEQYFITGAAKFITQDEESSGIINVNKFLKASGDTKSHFFLNAQVHSKLSVARPDLVAGLGTTEVMALDSKAIEGGQYYHLAVDWTKVTFA